MVTQEAVLARRQPLVLYRRISLQVLSRWMLQKIPHPGIERCRYGHSIFSILVEPTQKFA